MNLDQLIACEQRPFWSIRLRQLLDDETRIREARSLAECQALLRGTNSCLAVIEAREDNLTEVWTWTHQLTSQLGHAQVVVVGSREMCPYEWPLREAGALQTVFSPRKVATLRPILDRCRARYRGGDASRAPFTALTEFETIWSRLPWT